MVLTIPKKISRIFSGDFFIICDFSLHNHQLQKRLSETHKRKLLSEELILLPLDISTSLLLPNYTTDCIKTSPFGLVF